MISDGRAEISRPGPQAVIVEGVSIRAGARVLLRPRTTETDILMRAIDGRRAIVDAVVQDTENEVKLTVSLEDDPARALGKGRGLGHRFFLSPDEVMPLEADASETPRRMLVGGIGNIFMGDDGFGVAVAQRLARRPLPDGVDVVDFGIRGMDLAYALNDGYDVALLVDASPRGQPPGTLEVIEPEIDPTVFVDFQAHGMNPVAVLQLAAQFGPLPTRTLVVGCEPQTLGNPDGPDLLEGLSDPVRHAVDPAVALVCELLEELTCRPLDEDHPLNHNQGGGR